MTEPEHSQESRREAHEKVADVQGSDGSRGVDGERSTKHPRRHGLSVPASIGESDDQSARSISRRGLIGAVSLVSLAVGNLAAPHRGAVGRSVTSDADFPSLEAALMATTAGGVLEIRTPHRRETAFVVDKPATIRFLERGSIRVSTSSAAAIVISSSDVWLDRPVVRGPGGGAIGEGDGIRAVGTADAPLRRIHVLGPRVSEFPKHGILLEHVHAFSISDLDIRRCGYAGVMLLSAVNGTVARGLVQDVLQPEGYPNSYGVAVSRRSTGSITGSAPRSRDVLVERVTVDGVRAWEGLDSHAGENVTFRGNSIYNSRTGIAVVGSKDQTGGAVYAPINCHVLDNTLDSGTGDGTAGRGIVFAGAADSLGEPTELATGRVAGNVVRGYGEEASPAGASIQVYGSAGVSVADNILIDSGSSAIDFYHDNYGAKATGNTIIDVWTNSASMCSAVTVRSAHNRLVISGTTIVRQGKQANKINDRGLTIAADPTNVVLDGGGNDWASATTYPTVGDAVTSEFRSFAKKTGFNGVTAVPRADLIPSPNADSADLKAAVDSIRRVLASVGLTR